MNKKVLSIGFVVLLFSLSIINLLKPQRDFSENENRFLQKFPSARADTIFSGKFSSDFADYSSDQFIGRDGWISFKTIAELSLLKKDNGRVYFGKNGTLFDATEKIDENRLLENTVIISDYIEALREKLPGLDASVLLIPTASEVNSELLPTFAPVPDQQTAIRSVKAVIWENAKVCDPTDLLKSSKGNYLYYRTDHHWTTEAAYLVYTKWAQENGLNPVSREDLDVRQVSGSFYGTLYSKANLFTIKPDSVKAYSFSGAVPVSAAYGKNKTTDSLYFNEYLSEKDKYSYFLGGNRPLIEINTGTKNGKTMMIIQDSYAHCFVPFLTSHYERILVLDPRYLSNIDYQEYAVENNVILISNKAVENKGKKRYNNER